MLQTWTVSSRLNVPTDGKTLQFTFIGMAPQELAVADAPMKVVMSDKEKKLDEVVVTGYQKSTASCLPVRPVVFPVKKRKWTVWAM